jgi:hypothetical protein
LARGARGPRTALAAVLLVLLVTAAGAEAQELEPRAYRTLPIGLNFVVLSYQFSSGNVLVDPTAPIEDLEVDVSVTTMNYLRSFALAGRSASITMSVPYVYLSGSAVAEGVLMSDSRSGSADVRMRAAVNLLGGPSLSPREFANYRQGRNLGVGLTVTAPTGQYDPSRLINFGTNRWSFKPEIGYSSIRGPWIFEPALGAWLFTENTDYFGGTTRSQDPLVSLQVHLNYNLKGGVWLALSANYFTGGRTEIESAESDDLQRNSRVGLTVSLPLGGPHSLKLATHSGAYTTRGADFDVGAVAYQYRW